MHGLNAQLQSTFYLLTWNGEISNDMSGLFGGRGSISQGDMQQRKESIKSEVRAQLELANAQELVNVREV